MEIAILIFVILTLVSLNILIIYSNYKMSNFEKEASEANKSLGQFMIKLAEEMQAIDNRLVEVDKRLGQEIADISTDISEVNFNVLRIMEHRNLVGLNNDNLENYLRS